LPFIVWVSFQLHTNSSPGSKKRSHVNGFSNNGTLGGHVQVGDHAVVGGLTAVHQFCRIGRFAITGGCSKIVQDVPPFMIADGNPAEIRGINLVGVERKNFPPKA